MIKMTLKDLNAIVERTFTGRRRGLEPTGLLDTMRQARGRRGVVGGMTAKPIISFQPKAPEAPKLPASPKAPRPPRKYPFLRG